QHTACFFASRTFSGLLECRRAKVEAAKVVRPAFHADQTHAQFHRQLRFKAVGIPICRVDVPVVRPCDGPIIAAASLPHDRFLGRPLDAANELARWIWCYCRAISLSCGMRRIENCREKGGEGSTANAHEVNHYLPFFITSRSSTARCSLADK